MKPYDKTCKKSQVEILRKHSIQKGRTKLGRFASQNEMADSQCVMASSVGVFQRCQIGFYRGIVYPQELVGGGHHVDAVRLAFSSLFVHKLVD